MIEKDSVIISLDEYNKLRDFKLNHLKGYKRVELKTTTGYYVTFLTNDEAIKSLQKELDEEKQTSARIIEMYREAEKRCSWFESMDVSQFKKWKNDQK